MHVDILYNPGSGRGKAERTARRFDAALRRAGHQPRLRGVGSLPASQSRPDLLLLVGGDGTVKHALRDAIDLDLPVYHAPLGNENLFARQFDMSRDPALLLGAIQAWDVAAMDLAEVEGIPMGSASTAPQRSELFSIMLSLGPDASVIHRMARDGRSAPGHLAYLAPICEEIAEPRLVPITARVDGRPVVDTRPGLIVVANLRHYGFRVDPAPDANPQDGLLDAVFIPATGVAPLLLAAACARLGCLPRLAGVVFARGRVVEIEAPGGVIQVDGEALGLQTPLRITARPGVLRVLRPPGVRDVPAGVPLPARPQVAP